MGIQAVQSIVAWEDPPPPNRPSMPDTWNDVIDLLKQNPRMWARITERPSPESARSFGRRIQRGEQRAFRPESHWEVRWRDTFVWLRYVGDK